MDDDDVDIMPPILISKTKLKSLQFANRQSILLKGFKDLENEKLEKEPKPICIVKKSFVKDKEDTENITNSTEKRKRDESVDKQEKQSKISKIDSDDEKEKKVEKKTESKSRIKSDNFRALCMKKRYKVKCKPGTFNMRGSKYKKTLWVKNKQQIEANARYGYKDEDDNEVVDQSINHNLIITDNLSSDQDSDKEIDSDSGDKDEDEDASQQAKSTLMSNEEIFASLRKE